MPVYHLIPYICHLKLTALLNKPTLNLNHRFSFLRGKCYLILSISVLYELTLECRLHQKHKDSEFIHGTLLEAVFESYLCLQSHLLTARVNTGNVTTKINVKIQLFSYRKNNVLIRNSCNRTLCGIIHGMFVMALKRGILVTMRVRGTDRDEAR
jgi:hypothetical protein